MNSGGWVVDENEEVRQSRHAKSDRNHSFRTELWYERYNRKATARAGEATFIDIDEPQDDEDKEYSRWNELPDLLLEKIFAYLTIRERYYASLVCKGWFRAFHLPYVWSQFVLEDRTLTRSKFNYYLGWQYVLDHLRTSLCLSSIGKNVRCLIIKPMLSFSNLYDFVNILSWYMEQQVQKENVVLGIGCNIRHLKFTFPCNMTTGDEDERLSLFGTGGKLLAGLKRLMVNLKGMRGLELVDLMLEPSEAQFLLDEVCLTCQMSMRTLKLVNATKFPYQILHVGVFLNLFELHISPQNIGDDLVEMLGFTKLKHLHLVQNRYTTDESFIRPVCPRVWKAVRTNNPALSVHLEVESKEYKWAVWQEGAPVRSVLYNSPQIGVRAELLLNAIDYYRSDLRIYGHLNVPTFHVPTGFTNRNDENYMLLVRSCSYLSTLIITENISTATVLLLAYTGRNLKWFHVRGKAVIVECDWPRSIEWSESFYSWLKMNSASCELVENEVSQIFGYKWRFLSDKDFERLDVDLHDY